MDVKHTATCIGVLSECRTKTAPSESRPIEHSTRHTLAPKSFKKTAPFPRKEHMSYKRIRRPMGAESIPACCKTTLVSALSVAALSEIDLALLGVFRALLERQRLRFLYMSSGRRNHISNASAVRPPSQCRTLIVVRDQRLALGAAFTPAVGKRLLLSLSLTRQASSNANLRRGRVGSERPPTPGPMRLGGRPASTPILVIYPRHALGLAACTCGIGNRSFGTSISGRNATATYKERQGS